VLLRHLLFFAVLKVVGNGFSNSFVQWSRLDIICRGSRKVGAIAICETNLIAGNLKLRYAQPERLMSGTKMLHCTSTVPSIKNYLFPASEQYRYSTLFRTLSRIIIFRDGSHNSTRIPWSAVFASVCQLHLLLGLFGFSSLCS